MNLRFLRALNDERRAARGEPLASLRALDKIDDDRRGGEAYANLEETQEPASAARATVADDRRGVGVQHAGRDVVPPVT